MADPTKYVPSYSYSNWQTPNPTKPLPAPQVDNDLANVSFSINQTIDAVKDVRRADGKLVNGIVTTESLAPQLSLGFSLEGQWQAGLTYDAGDGVVYDSVFYKAAVRHVSEIANAPGNTDYWILLFSVEDLAVAGALSMPAQTFAGDGVTTAYTLGFTPVSVRNLIVTVGGLPQAVTEYSVNGNMLIFDVAPPLEYAIEVRGFATTAVLVVPVDGSVTYEKLDPGVFKTYLDGLPRVTGGDISGLSTGDYYFDGGIFSVVLP